jgi:hypothetical protein
MRVSYKPLVRVRLRHSYYTDGRSTRDCVVEPAPATRIRLEQAGLVFRRLPDGCAIYGEVVPGSNPPKLLRPLGADPMRLVFLLSSINNRFEQMTALPQHRPTGTVFHFTNLRQDKDQGRLYLGDRTANARIGPAVLFVTSALCTHRVAAPATGLTLSLADMFGNAPRPVPYAVSAATQAGSELRANLAAVPSLSAGRYILSDSAGGSLDLYYDPGLGGSNPLGLIELFSSTQALTGNGQELLPEDYRFVIDDALDAKDYYVQFERLQTIWRYNLIKRYEKKPIEFEKLYISGPFEFAPSTQGDCAIFTSKKAIPLAERPYGLVLHHGEVRIRGLPNPNVGLSLKKGDGEGALVSEVNVYV